MSKITYLIGAGASRNAVPIVNEIPKRIEQMIAKLQEPNFKISPNDLYEGLPVKTAKIEVQEAFPSPQCLFLKAMCAGKDIAAIEAQKPVHFRNFSFSAMSLSQSLVCKQGHCGNRSTKAPQLGEVFGCLGEVCNFTASILKFVTIIQHSSNTIKEV